MSLNRSLARINDERSHGSGPLSSLTAEQLRQVEVAAREQRDALTRQHDSPVGYRTMIDAEDDLPPQITLPHDVRRAVARGKDVTYSSTSEPTITRTVTETITAPGVRLSISGGSGMSDVRENVVSFIGKCLGLLVLSIALVMIIWVCGHFLATVATSVAMVLSALGAAGILSICVIVAMVGVFRG